MFYKTQLILLYCLLLNTIVFGQNDKIKSEIEQLNILYQTSTNDADRLANYTKMAQRYRFIDVDSSKHYLWKALAAHRTLDANRRSMAFAYNVIGNIYRLEPNIDSAKYYYEEAYSFFTKENEYKLIQAIVPPYASLLTENGEIERGMNMFYNAIDLAKSKDDYPNLAFLYEYLGSIFLNVQQNDQRAIEVFEKGIAVSQNFKEDEMNYSRITASLSLNLSDIYLKNSQSDSTINYAQKVIDLREINKMPQLVVEAYNNISQGYILKKQYREATFYNQQANQLNKKIQNAAAQVDIQIIEQAIYLNTKNYNQCIQVGENILKDKAYQLKNKVLIFNQLCECYAFSGNTKAALAYKDSLLTYSQKLFDNKREELILKLDREYQVEQKETENELLKTEKELAQKTLRSQTAITVGLIAVLLLIGGWSFLIYRNSQQRKRYNKILEEKVKERTKNLEQANYELRTFNYIASHDIKEPIRVIGGYAGLIFRKLPNDLKESLSEYFDTIKRSTNQLYTLIEDFAHYTTMSKNDTIEKEAVDLNQLVYGVIDNLQESIHKYKGEVIINHLPTIQSSNSLLFTTLKNLIENGLKYNNSDNRIINIEYNQTQTHHQIIVSDNGIGIDQEYHEKIFEMFKRLHNRGEYKGSGIGLAIVKLSVEKLNGTVKLESEKGKGSRFVIELPC